MCILFVIFSLNLVGAERKAILIVDVKGKVEIKSFKQTAWVPAKVGSVLYEKDAIRTDKKSFARIKYSEGTISSIEENSEIVVENFSEKMVTQRKLFKKVNVPVKKIKMKLIKGNIFSKIKKLKSGSSFNIATPSSVCGVRGTSFDVANQAGKDAEFKVLEGVVDVVNPEFPDVVVKLNKGQKTSVKKGKKPAPAKQMSKSEMKKMVEKQKVINKVINLTLKPKFVGKSKKIIKSDKNSKTVEYIAKIKNIIPDKVKVMFKVTKDGQPYQNVEMKMIKGDKEPQNIKTYSATVVLDDLKAKYKTSLKLEFK
jgi:hypothetical protein